MYASGGLTGRGPEVFRCSKFEPHVWGPCKVSAASDRSAYCDGMGKGDTAVDCPNPRCAAKAGRPCNYITKYHREKHGHTWPTPHRERQLAAWNARRAADGQPPVDAETSARFLKKRGA